MGTRLRGAATVFLAIALAALPRTASAFFERLDTSGRALANGEAFLPLATDAAGVTYNAGALGALAHPEVQLSVAQPYFVSGLLSSSAAVAWPVLGGGVGAAWHRLGNEFLSEDVWFLSGGRWVYRDDRGTAYLGGALKIGHVGYDAGIDGTDGTTAVTVDLGALYALQAGVSAAAVVRNLGEPDLELVEGSGGTPWETRTELGLAYHWRPESTVSAGWSSDERARDAWRLGGEIWFYDVFAVRAGVLGAEFAGGFGLRTQRLEVDAGFVTHSQLGLSGRLTLVVPVGGWR